MKTPLDLRLHICYLYGVIEIRIHQAANGKIPFKEWLMGIDMHARERVQVAIGRLEEGNVGNVKSVGGGVFEIKIDHGPGYRVYLEWESREIAILLCGGTKKRQAADIKRAKEIHELRKGVRKQGASNANSITQ